MTNLINLPKPGKFANECGIEVWLNQFELFLDLAKITDGGDKLKILLGYLDVSILQAVINGVPKIGRDFDGVAQFLIDRYGQRDPYLNRLELFELQYAGSAKGGFAAEMNSLMDKYNAKGVAKFISSITANVGKEMRMRRPSTINECVKILNSFGRNVQCSSVNNSSQRLSPRYQSKPSTSSESGNRRVCFRCGNPDHDARSNSCPARDATCRKCEKKGHYARVCRASLGQVQNAQIVFQISGIRGRKSLRGISSLESRPDIVLDVYKSKVKFMVDTGSQISVLTVKDFNRVAKRSELRPSERIKCINADGSGIRLIGWLSDVKLNFKERSKPIDFLIGDVSQSLLGMDAIKGLQFTLSCGLRQEAKVSKLGVNEPISASERVSGREILCPGTGHVMDSLPVSMDVDATHPVSLSPPNPSSCLDSSATFLQSIE
jgi:hypothetical protein